VYSGRTLFFRASKSCSNIVNVKSMLNTAKNFMTNSVVRARASSSKILKDKNISMQWRISGQTLFSRACASCSKFWMIKNIHIFNTMNSEHTLFFRASHKLLKSPERQKFFNTVKSFRATLFFRARKLFKNLNAKKSLTGRQGRQGREFLP